MTKESRKQPQQPLHTSQPTEVVEAVTAAAEAAGISRSLWVGIAIGERLERGPIGKRKVDLSRQRRQQGRPRNA